MIRTTNFKQMLSLVLSVFIFMSILCFSPTATFAAGNPDLYVMLIETATTNVYDMDYVTFRAVIRNIGDSVADKSTSIKFYVDGKEIQTVSLGSNLAANGKVTVSTTDYWFAGFGTHRVTASINESKAIAENDYSNNIFKKRITVIDGLNPNPQPTTQPSTQPTTQPEPTGIGANMPYDTYEAEVGKLAGGAILVADDGDRLPGTLNGEASGRSAVNLTSNGASVEITAKDTANSIVVRACIPPQSQETLSVYVNNVKRGTITFDSKYCWIKNSDDLTPGQTAKGAGKLDGSSKHIYDEGHLLLNYIIKAGDKVKLQKDADNTAQWYGIDFIDLEYVAPPKTKPSNLLSITECGAVEGGANCFNAIQTAINKAISDGYKGIWIPEGEWYMEGTYEARKVVLPVNTPSDFEIAGAGMWYSKLCAINPTTDGDDWGKFGFNPMGKTAYWHDFSMWGQNRQRIEGGKPFVNGYGQNTVMENIWIEHTTCGFWVGGALHDFYQEDRGADKALLRQSNGLKILNCRIRNTGADGINLCAGTCDALVQNVHCRSTGDDAFAMWSEKDGWVQSDDHNPGGSEGNLIINCTAELPWRANCYGIYGGKDNTVKDCIARDTLSYCAIYMTVETYQSVPYSGTATFENMIIERCSGRFWGDNGYPAIWIQKTSTGKIVLKDLEVNDSLYSPLWIYGTNDMEITNVTFDGFCKYKTDASKPGNMYQLGGIYSEGSAGTYKFNNVNFYNHGGRGADGRVFFWASWGDPLGGTVTLNNCNFKVQKDYQLGS